MAHLLYNSAYCVLSTTVLLVDTQASLTYHRLRRLFSWPKMKEDTHADVQSCQVCQQAKPERIQYPGLLEPLHVPDGTWKVVTMDFIDGLPQSSNANCILVMVDKYTRYAHFLPLNHPFTAAKVARSYLENVYKLHGLSAVIISDRDPVFTNRFWTELFNTIGTELQMSTPYHPKLTVRLNASIKAWRFISSVSPMHAPKSGVSILPLLNSGITLATTLLSKPLHLLLSMVMNLHTGGLKLFLPAKILNSRNGSRSANSCNSCCTSICTEHATL